MHFIRTLETIDPGELDLVGGKALGLARLVRAGFQVPPAFCITTAAHRVWQAQPASPVPGLENEIAQAYKTLGRGLVAVRSSLTVEDGSATSLAGLALTQLGVAGPRGVIDAVLACWLHLRTGPIEAYLRRVRASGNDVAAAVLVQTLIPAEVSGVLFTRDPLTHENPGVQIEASWGLGESVVGGTVMPDRFALEPDGRIRDQQIARKWRLRTPTGIQDVPTARQAIPCLSPADLAELLVLGRRVVEQFGSAWDMEWCKAAGKWWLLQVRPITTDNVSALGRVRARAIAHARGHSRGRLTAWYRDVLCHEVPEPTPMTWAVLSRFISGQGGYGLCYRDMGFAPDPCLDASGAYDLFCGRLYCNLGRVPLFYANGLPLAHDLEALRRDPTQADQARPCLDLGQTDARFWLGLPGLLWRAVATPRRLDAACRTFAVTFRDRILPEYRRDLDRAAAVRWQSLDDTALREQFDFWLRRVLCEFARQSLKPGLLATHLELIVMQRLTSAMGASAARAALGELVCAIPPDPQADLVGALRALAEGKLDRPAFLQQYGHRGGMELELAAPRWRERPDLLDGLNPLVQPTPSSPPSSAIPANVQNRIAELVEGLRTYLGLRESARHYFFAGYALLRSILLEWDRRLGLAGGIFYLRPEDLTGSLSSTACAARSAAVQRERTLELGLPMPAVLFSDQLEAIGEQASVQATPKQSLQGIALSPGIAEGAAFVPCDANEHALPVGPFILVCASTDPAWIRIAMQARGLVMETGGVLSHGAILARELGLPAVGGVAGACERLRQADRVRVDGFQGLVTMPS